MDGGPHPGAPPREGRPAIPGLAVAMLAVLLCAGWTVAEEVGGEPDADETVTVRGDSTERIVVVPSEPVDGPTSAHRRS